MKLRALFRSKRFVFLLCWVVNACECGLSWTLKVDVWFSIRYICSLSLNSQLIFNRKSNFYRNIPNNEKTSYSNSDNMITTKTFQISKNRCNIHRVDKKHVFWNHLLFFVRSFFFRCCNHTSNCRLQNQRHYQKKNCIKCSAEKKEIDIL